MTSFSLPKGTKIMKNHLEVSEVELAKGLTIHITIQRSNIFRLRWWLFLGLFKVLGRICPIRLEILTTDFTDYTEKEGGGGWGT